jgi:seryl-tRNA synthetase
MLNFIKDALKGSSAQAPAPTSIVHSSQSAMDALLDMQRQKQAELDKLKDEHNLRQKEIDQRKAEAALKQKTMMAVVDLQGSIKAMQAQLQADDLASQEADQLLIDTDAEIWQVLDQLRNA